VTSRPFRLQEATIDDIHSAFISGELTCRGLVELYLARIEAYDRSGPELNAILTINPKVLEEAEDLDRAFGQGGEFVGPLHGIPVLVKDQAETAGIRTAFGSVAFEEYVPEEDATAVRRMKEAGAVVLGKTNLRTSRPPGSPTPRPAGRRRTPTTSTGTRAAPAAARGPRSRRTSGPSV
jgi:Asp-tRNA(Asn)/Glu-tRNA(Gln) amidotransferase A subunit family amidase